MIKIRLGLNTSKWIGQPTNDIAFRILVKTDNAGVSNNDQFQFTGAVGDYDVEVWDSTGTTLQETITGLSGAATITIAAGAGTYELRVFAAETGGFNRIAFTNTGDKSKLLEVRNWGNVAWSSMEFAFFGCSNLISVNSLVQPNLANVTSAFGMFSFCTSVETINTSDFNTENITSMRAMFQQCNSLEFLNLSSFNTANVTNMRQMFDGCSNLTNPIGIEDFNISSVSDFSNFLLNVTLPTSSYDQLLINYEAQAPNTGLSFHGGNSKYTAGSAASDARRSLETTYNWTIIDGGAGALLIDDYPNAEAAFSLDTLLYSNHSVTDTKTGSETNGDTGAFTILARRASSPNVWRSFTPGEITDGTLTTWASSFDVFVERWYNQGTADDAVQTDTADQPRIVSGGNLDTINGRASLLFVTDFLTIPNSTDKFNFLHDGSGGTFITVLQYISSGFRYAFGNDGNNSSNVGNSMYIWDGSSFSVTRTEAIGYNVRKGVSGQLPVVSEVENILPAAQQAIISMTVDADNAVAADRLSGHLDDGADFSANTSTIAPSTADASFDMQIAGGGNTNPGGLGLIGYMQFFAIFSQSYNRADIVTDINEYYNAY